MKTCRPLQLLAVAAVMFLAACGGSRSSTSTSSGTPTIAIAPAAGSVPPGASLQLQANLTNSSSTAVTWAISSSGTSEGTMSSSGLYTAPAAAPSPNTVNITATSQADSSLTASATITVLAAGYSNASLQGQYAISFSGHDNSGAGIAWAGSFAADGHGNITNGIEDINDGLNGVTPAAAFTGSYAIGPDGRGTLTLLPAGGTTENFRIVLSSAAPSAAAQIIDFDAGTAGLGSGQILQQTPAAFTTSAFSGKYAFLLQGEDDSQYAASGASYPWAIAGECTASGAGSISACTEDSNDALATSSGPLNGTYALSIDANGRGTLTLPNPQGGTADFVVYAVSGSEFLFLDTDANDPLLGTAELEQNLPTTLQGNYVFALSGYDAFQNSSSQTVLYAATAAGAMTTDGNGNITAGDSDYNDEGTLNGGSSQPFALSSGTYSLPASGRITMAFLVGGSSTNTFSVYMFNAQQGFMVETDGTSTDSGMMYAQAASPAASAVAGYYTFSLSGWDSTNAASAAPTPLSLLGELSADGVSAWAGTQDVNDNASLTPSQAISGTFKIGSLGRGTATAGSSNYVVYVISPSQFVLLGAYTSTVIGTAQLY
ncbi:MAG: Ig-like domain-containing protein [Terriglobales bacterium]